MNKGGDDCQLTDEWATLIVCGQAILVTKYDRYLPYAGADLQFDKRAMKGDLIARTQRYAATLST